MSFPEKIRIFYRIVANIQNMTEKTGKNHAEKILLMAHDPATMFFGTPKSTSAYY